jgi:hypothetical protein
MGHRFIGLHRVLDAGEHQTGLWQLDPKLHDHLPPSLRKDVFVGTGRSPRAPSSRESHLSMMMSFTVEAQFGKL